MLHFSAMEHLKNEIKVVSILKKKKDLTSCPCKQAAATLFLVYCCVVVELHFWVTYPSTHVYPFILRCPVHVPTSAKHVTEAI